jgi:hypothetical protein
MATVQVIGRGTYGPQIPQGQGVSRLWLYKKSVPSQMSLLIYKDGTVEEGMSFLNWDIKSDDVYQFVLGGTDYRCEVGSFEYEALLAAGYSFRTVVPRDTYSEYYQDDY